MVELERAETRIQVICDKIRSETLDPAKEQAQEIIENARKEAERILHQANKDAEHMVKETRKSLEEEKQIFQSSLEQASKQSIEMLKQKIEESLFNPTLEKWIKDHLGNASSYGSLIDALVKAIQKDGIKSDLTVQIPKAFKADEINAELSQNIIKQLKDHSVELSDLPGGVRVKILGKNMVLDLSSKALQDIVASYIHKDFRKVFFGSE